MNYEWADGKAKYVIRNVPYSRIDGEIYFTSNVSINLAAIRELATEGKIPDDVDYGRISHIRI